MRASAWFSVDHSLTFAQMLPAHRMRRRRVEARNDVAIAREPRARQRLDAGLGKSQEAWQLVNAWSGKIIDGTSSSPARRTMPTPAPRRNNRRPATAPESAGANMPKTDRTARREARTSAAISARQHRDQCIGLSGSHVTLHERGAPPSRELRPGPPRARRFPTLPSNLRNHPATPCSPAWQCGSRESDRAMHIAPRRSFARWLSKPGFDAEVDRTRLHSPPSATKNHVLVDWYDKPASGKEVNRSCIRSRSRHLAAIGDPGDLAAAHQSVAT